MVQTSQMPASIHSDISVEAVGEALLQHYNVGITNPWYELGLSDQETYNRRRLPWSDNTYQVDTESETVSGPNVESLPDNLVNQWVLFANEAEAVIGGTEGEHDGLEDFYDTLVQMDPGSVMD